MFRRKQGRLLGLLPIEGLRACVPPFNRAWYNETKNNSESTIETQ